MASTTTQTIVPQHPQTDCATVGAGQHTYNLRKQTTGAKIPPGTHTRSTLSSLSNLYRQNGRQGKDGVKTRAKTGKSEVNPREESTVVRGRGKARDEAREGNNVRGKGTAKETTVTLTRRPVRRSKVTKIPVLTTHSELPRDTAQRAKECRGVSAVLKEAAEHGKEGRGRAAGVRRSVITSATAEEDARDGATKPAKHVSKPVVKPVMPVKPVTAVSYHSELHLVPLQPAADIDCTDDPALCGEYSGDIYQYHRQLEEQEHYAIRTSFLDHQLDITSHHRQVLVDWLAQVHIRYKLLQETMLLTVDILDRYLQVAVVPKVNLQLVGITSLLISSKYEEIYGPCVYDLEHIAANTYTRPQILAMEQTILQELDYRLLKPYPIHFLRRFSRLSDADGNVHHMAKYFIDLSLLTCAGSTMMPSKKAAAAFLLACALLSSSPLEDIWTTKLQRHTGYSLSDLTGTASVLKNVVKAKHSSERAKAIQERYLTKAPTELVKFLLSERRLAFPSVRV